MIDLLLSVLFLSLRGRRFANKLKSRRHAMVHDVMSPCKKGDFISEKRPLQLWHVFILSTFTSRDMEELPATCNALIKT